MNSEATPDVQNDLDRIALDQLHGVLLNVSKNCFEIKKLCATLLVSASVLVSSFTSERLDHSLFVSAVIVIGFFWILDAESYFYQEKIRERMKQLQGDILARNGFPAASAEGVGMELLDTRVSRGRWLRSLFNISMLFYLLLTLVAGAAWLLFIAGLIS